VIRADTRDRKFFRRTVRGGTAVGADDARPWWSAPSEREENWLVPNSAFLAKS
jgi:hypothetical protein